MPEFIQPVVEQVLAVLRERTPALLETAGLDVFVDYEKQFTGTNMNFPNVAASPVRTDFDAESAVCDEQHLVRIKFGVSGSEPDDVAVAAVQYAAAIHRALADSWPADWTETLEDGVVTRLFVERHNYGPLMEYNGAIARFPEIDLVVEARESWGTLEGV